jgi:S1-C subfamily serine protease
MARDSNPYYFFLLFLGMRVRGHNVTFEWLPVLWQLLSATGTGFIVNSDGVVVTARHVVRKTNPSETPRISIEMRTPAAVVGTNAFKELSLDLPAEILAEDVAHDIAVLKTSENLLTAQNIRIVGQEPPAPRSTAKFDVRHLRDGEPIFSSGYPLNSWVLITNSGFVASSEPEDIEIRAGQFKLKDSYLLDLRLNHGSSGGPLFSSNSAAVIGFADQIQFANVEFLDNTPGLSYGTAIQGTPAGPSFSLHPLAYNAGVGVAIPATYIADLLSQNNIRLENVAH